MNTSDDNSIEEFVRRADKADLERISRRLAQRPFVPPTPRPDWKRMLRYGCTIAACVALAVQLVVLHRGQERICDQLATLAALGSKEADGATSRFVAAGSALVLPIRLPQLTPIVTGRRLALVIGVSDAPGRERLFAAEDAHRFCEDVLVGQLGFAPGDIRLLSDHPDSRLPRVTVTPYGDATEEQVERGLEWLRMTAQPGDMVVLFVASHGQTGGSHRGPELALVLSDGSYFFLTSALEALLSIPDVLKLGIVDSCFSGDGLLSLDDYVEASASNVGGPALILTSAASGEESWTDVAGGTGAFQAGLREAFYAADAADVNRDGFLSADELVTRLTDTSNRLLAKAPRLQSPQLRAFPPAYSDLPLFAVRPLTPRDREELIALAPLLGPVRRGTPVPPVRQEFYHPRDSADPQPTDEVGERFYVYKDGESGALFLPTGFIPTGLGIAVDPDSTDNPLSGTTCLRSHVQLSQTPFAGVSFLLDGTFRPDRSIDLLKALSARHGDHIVCRFWARSALGARVKFRIGGNAQGEHHDSLMMGGDSGLLRLTGEWHLYEIDLTGKDLSSVVTAFSWTCARTENGDRDLSFSLDDIYFVKVHSTP